MQKHSSKFNILQWEVGLSWETNLNNIPPSFVKVEAFMEASAFLDHLSHHGVSFLEMRRSIWFEMSGVRSHYTGGTID